MMDLRLLSPRKSTWTSCLIGLLTLSSLSLTGAYGNERLKELNQQIAKLQTKVGVVKTPEFGYHSATASQQDTEKWVEVELNKETDISKITLHPCHDDFGGIGAGFGFPLRFRVEVLVGGNWQNVYNRTQTDVPNPGLTAVETTELNIKTQKIYFRDNF